ncbi:MAG TPA: hypothetical protein VH593_29780 [Ktedonobacteraceae bacterium]|jgi:hypothetical protein
MASNYVFGNYALQFLASNVPTRFRMYGAALSPIAIVVQSQDVQTDQFGQYSIISNTDLLAAHQPPYAPQPNFGPNRIGFVGEPLFFDGSRSTQRNNIAAIGHSWGATGSPSSQYYTNINTNDQIVLTWSSPGLYFVTLFVADRFGSSLAGTRQVMIYNSRDEAAAGIISLSGVTGSIDSGGWTAQVTATKAFGVVLPEDLPIGSYQPIVIACETEYEVSPGNWLRQTIGPYGAPIPGQFYDDPTILFNGYIQQGTAYQDSEKDTVAFTLQSTQMIAQAAGLHNIGYYNTTYNTRVGPVEPTSQNTSPVGIGQLVTDLTSEDIYRSLLCGQLYGGSLLGGHSNIGQYHDIRIWRDFLPVPNATTYPLYYLTYSNLTANEGSIWDACQALTENEYGNIWSERDGSICIGPTYNMRGYEMMNQATAYGQFPLSQVTTYGGELNNNVLFAAQTAYMHFLFGPNALPQRRDLVNGGSRDLSTLVGPPILAHISDTPIYDTGSAPTDQGLLPWVVANWPQDLSLRPITTTVDENYTNRTSFVKLVGTITNLKAVWSAWYPTSTFDSTGLMLTQVAAGTWQVDSNLLLADITVSNQKTLSWQYIWEMARRRYLALNAPYTSEVTLGLATWPTLHGLYQLTRQNATDGPQFDAEPFYITDVSFSIDLEKQQWQTDIKGAQVTTFGIGAVITPPFPPPAS